MLKYSSPTSLSPYAAPVEKFHTIISLHKGSEADIYVQDLLRETGWHGSYEIIYDGEHIDAMAASDVGLIYDG